MSKRKVNFKSLYVEDIFAKKPSLMP